MQNAGVSENKMAARIRALLAKAESTTFAEEAEALIAKAQELMARHSIDGAMLRDAGSADEKPIMRRIDIARPYASAKQTLLARVAAANNVSAVLSYERVTLVGFAADVDAAELLFTSLLVQASAAVLRVPPEEVGRGTRAFRHAFFIGFAYRIGERLREARSAAESAAAVEHGPSLLPVLAGRRLAVDRAVVEAFPHLSRGRRPSITDYGGAAMGARAANSADLGGRNLRLVQ